MTLLKETGGSEALKGAVNRDGKIIREITLISEGWGSSGYYSMDVLERDVPRVFPKGTHMYMNHPTLTERQERPERDVEKLAAVLISTPRKRGIEMVAEAEIKPHWAPVIDALAEDIGTSIIANGIAEEGSAGGKDGAIVKALTEGFSVDFVTKAGAGGKVGPLIESAAEKSIELEEARNALNWFESRIHRDFTSHADYMFGEGFMTREERIALSTGIGDALKAFTSSVEANAPGLLNRDPFAEAPTEEVSVEENKEGVSPSEQKEAHSMGAENEERLTELTESVRKLEEKQKEHDAEVKKLQENLDAEKARADRAEEVLMAQEAGRIVGEALKDHEGIPASAKARVAESLLKGDLPKHSDGKLDSSKLKESAIEAAKKEAEYIAALTGNKSVSESTSKVGGGSGSEDTSEAALEEAFQSMGLPESIAKKAAKGR